MVDFPSSAKALDALNTLAQTLARGNASLGTSIIMSAGDGIVSPDATSGTGNVLNLAGGDNTGGTVSDTGGDVSIAGGDANGGAGGSILVAGGDSTSVAGGSLVLTPGTGPGGDGLLSLTRSGIQMVERAAVPGPAIGAGQGRLWLRNDSPNVLVFTNDSGSDTVLGQGGGGASQVGVLLTDLQFYMDPGNSASYTGTGATVTDIQGNGTGGTLTSSSFTDGGFEFDGTSGDLTFTKSAAIDNIFTGGGTLLVAFKARGNGEATLGRIVGTSTGAGASPTGGWFVRVENLSAGHLRATFFRDFVTTNGEWRTDTVTHPISGAVNPIHVGDWVVLAITYDDSSTTNDPTFYLDGFVVSNTEQSAPSGATVTDAGADLIFGNGASDDRTFDGWIGPSLLYDTVLTENEIRMATTTLLQRFSGARVGMNSTVVGVSGQSITLRAGDGDGANSESEGGDIFIYAGDHTGGAAAAAGKIIIKSGSGGNVSDAGEILIESGSNLLGSGVTVRVGDQTTGSTPGDLTLRGGDNLGAGFAGDVEIVSGAVTGSTRTTGSVTIRSQDGGARGGSSNQNSGDVNIQTGDPFTFGHAGSVNISTGNGVGVGGSISLTCGSTSSNSSPGADVTLTAGTNDGITRAGNVILSPGVHGAAGDDGIVDITSSGIRMAERTAVPIAAVAGQGILWVRNDTPNVLVFTDDAGTDTVLGAGGGGGGESLAATLAIGNTTGGTNIVVTSGDSILTADAATPGDLNLAGGSSTSGGGGGADIILTAGDADTSGTGGGVTLDGGAGGTTGIGGALNLTGGTGGSTSGTGGAVLISGGAVGASGGTGGAVTISSADGGPPGLLSLVGGSAGPTSGAAGAEIDLTAGAGDGAGAGGAIDINGGAAGATGTGGAVTINAGAGGGTSGAGGAITLVSGAPTSGLGGAISITVSDSVGTDLAGADVSIDAGNGTGTADGGNINLTPGTATGTGTDGAVIVTGKLTVTGLIDPTGLELTSQGSAPSTPAGSDGLVWVNSSSELVFTTSGGDTIISNTTQLSDAASAYLGYTTASIGTMSSTTWADLVGAGQPVTTVTDQVTRNISRTNSDFTFTNGGTYQADVRVNQGSSTSQYIAIRLTGSINGTLAVYANFYDSGATEEIVINQQIEVSDGEVVTVEYIVGTGAAGGWGTATLDSEPLRGFTCSFFSLAKTGDVSPRTGATIVAAHTSVIGERTLYNPSGGTFTITFPASPLNGDRVSTKNVTADTTAITISGNGNTVEDPASFSLGATASVAGDGLALDYEYSSAQGGWLLV